MIFFRNQKSEFFLLFDLSPPKKRDSDFFCENLMAFTNQHRKEKTFNSIESFFYFGSHTDNDNDDDDVCHCFTITRIF